MKKQEFNRLAAECAGVSLIKGVHYSKFHGKYIASIYFNKRRIALGGFDDYFAACCARKSAEAKYKFINLAGYTINSSEDVKKILSYDEKTGLFTWIVNTNNTEIGQIAGSMNSHGYIHISISERIYRAHRLAWLYVNGEWPDEIDHINHDRSDNRIINLRNVDSTGNSMNCSISKRNKTGIVGVRVEKRSGLYIASIAKNKSATVLGYFRDFFDACCARKSAEYRLGFHENHGEPVQKNT